MDFWCGDCFPAFQPIAALKFQSPNRQLTLPPPNQAWASDITYLATEEGWLFLAVVIDLFSRRVVGWSMQPDMRRSLVIDALEMAWFHRRPD